MTGGEKTKETIIKTAIKLFAELGYERTSMRTIAQNAGITKPAIYYYFPDKSSLFNGIFIFGAEMIENKMKEIYDSEIPALEKLKKIVLFRFEGIEDKETFSRFMTNVFNGSLKCDMKLDHRKFFNNQSTIIVRIIRQSISEGTLRKDLDIKSFMFCLLGAMNHYTREHFLNGAPALTSEKVDKIFEMLLSGAERRVEKKES